MLKLKYFFEKNKRLIMIACIILICSIAIAVGVYAQITNRDLFDTKNEEINNKYEGLKNNFEEIFVNNIVLESTAELNVNYEELVYCKYDVVEEKDGKYSINAKIPEFKGESETLKNINTEIFDVFAREVLKVVNESTVYTTYNVDYVAYVNNNIISLVIMCKYKDGVNPQRRIIQTYNYDVKNDKLVNIEDIIEYKKLDKEEMQKQIEKEIEEVNKQKKTIKDQGYNVYVRDEHDDIYKIEKTPNFFLGKNNYLYLIYAYGNKNHTSEIDLVIFK